MQLAEQIIVVESSVTNGCEATEHIKLVVGNTSDLIFHLSLTQARSLAMSLVEQVHRLEVANSMRKAKPQTRVARIGRQRTLLLNSTRTA